MSDEKEIVVQYRVGEWLPSDHCMLVEWLEALVQEAEAAERPWLPIIREFAELIESDAEIYMLFNQMFNHIPSKPPYILNPAKGPQVRDYQHMLDLLNVIMTKAPDFNESGLVGFPINAILDWSMGTEGGYAAFLNDKVNAMLKRVLNEWAIFLKSPDSTYVLNDDPCSGWLGDAAMVAMAKMLPQYQNEPVTPKEAKEIFAATFNCNTSEEHWGFTSWDDFFTRTFQEGQRPVACPDDPAVIVNACESAPYRIAKGVKLRDQFWIKAQPYSLTHMLDNDEHVEKFVGGTIYQAFLAAKSYHRWNSPVTGFVRKACVVDGTYYSEIPSEGFYNPLHTSDQGDGSQKPDPSAPNDSQGYISEVATRAMIFIESDNPKIGLMCFLSIGMAEVSSNQISVYEGQHVKKGDPLGTFHFGGSSHCLIFGPQVELEFDLHGQTPGLNSDNIAVSAKLATVTN